MPLFGPSLVWLVFGLAMIGLALWAITQFPMDATIAKVIRVVIVVVAVVWVLSYLVGILLNIPVPYPPHR